METTKMKAPQNSKSLLMFMFQCMEKVANGEMDNKTANTLTGLAAQANATLRNELMRTTIQLHCLQANTGISAQEVRIRNLESKAFAECGKDYYKVEEDA